MCCLLRLLQSRHLNGSVGELDQPNSFRGSPREDEACHHHTTATLVPHLAPTPPSSTGAHGRRKPAYTAPTLHATVRAECPCTACNAFGRSWPAAASTTSGTCPRRIPTEIWELFPHPDEGLLRVGQCRSNLTKRQCQPSWEDLLLSMGPVHSWVIHC